jgi:hypothetical protein
LLLLLGPWLLPFERGFGVGSRSSFIIFWSFSSLFKWSIAGRALVLDLVRRYGASKAGVELSFALLKVEALEFDVEYLVSRSIGRSGSEPSLPRRSLFLIVSGWMGASVLRAELTLALEFRSSDFEFDCIFNY